MFHPRSGPSRSTPVSRAEHPQSGISRRLLLSCAAAAALAACSDDDPNDATYREAPDEITYVTAFGLFGREAYVHVAQAKGFFAEADLTVSIQPGEGGPPNHQKLSAGVAQFASVDIAGALSRHAAGQDDLVIINAVQQLPLASIITLEGNGITRPYDLEGKTVAGAAGSAIEDLFPAYAQLAGFDPNTVEFTHVAPPSLPAVLASGQVDAIGLYLVGEPAVRAAVEDRDAVEDREVIVLPYGEILTDLYGSVTLTTRELLETDPDLVRRFNTALLRGLEYAVAHPAEAGEILHEAEPAADPEVAAKELEIMQPYVSAALGPDEPVGTISGARLIRAAGLLQSIGYLESGFDLTREPKIVAWDIVPGGQEEA